VNVSLCFFTKPWNDLSSPCHATPTTVTLPANFFATASTEGASALHVPQVGAQNQNAVGFPANSAPSTAPPPTLLALKL
jgi:hypothetical protein